MRDLPVALRSEKSTVADPRADFIASVSLSSADSAKYRADSSNLAAMIIV